MAVIDYTDRDGITRRVELNNKHEAPEKGIPLDMYYILDELFQEASPNFRIELYKRLYTVGLVEAKDFSRPRELEYLAR